MSQIAKSLAVVICISVLIISGIGCAKKAVAPAAATQVTTVRSGNLTVSTSVDGNLVMPQAYNLLFGAPGDVQEVLVEEGDVVKEGTVLATLDNTTQKLGVESSNNNVQTVLSKLYENVPLLPQFPTTIYQTNVATSVLPPDITTTTSQTTYLDSDTMPPLGTTTQTTTQTTTTGTLPGAVTETTTNTTTVTAVTTPGPGPTVVITPGPTTVVTTPGPTPVPGPPPITIGPGTTIGTLGTTIVTTTVTKTKTVTTKTTALTGVVGTQDTSSPYYYPNSTALSAYKWAQGEVGTAHALYQSANYTAAASELYIALSDLDACIYVLEDAMNNPQSGLGNMAPLVPSDEEGVTQLLLQTDQSFAVSYIVQLRQAVDTIKQGQADIDTVRGLIDQSKYDEASPMFAPLLKRVDDIGKVVYNNINVIKSHSYSTVYGKDISLYFYGAAADKLSAALKGIETGGLSAPELNDNLRVAQHYMQICNSILGSNDYVLQHGLSLKNEQQYHVDLQNALVGLGNSKDDFLKTVILAPFDGTVVSVGVKKNDVLSAVDYASKTAVQLVDTSQIKFQGQVDEIDILKIKTGQKATIEVDAVQNKTFTGTVSFISPFGTPDTNNVVKFPVTIMLDHTDVALKGGLTATADIEISSVESALLVPLSAVTTTSLGAFVTIVDEAGKQEKRQVTLGTQNLQFAEVSSGLKEGDKVVIEEKAIKAPVVTGFPQRGGGPPPSR